MQAAYQQLIPVLIRHFTVLVTAVLALASANLFAVSGKVVSSDSQLSVLINNFGAKQQDISNYLEVYQDTADRSFEDIVSDNTIIFRRSKDQSYFTGLGSKTYWVRARIRESTRANINNSRWLLVLEDPDVEGAELYVGRGGSRDKDAFTAVHPIKDRYLVYPLNLGMYDASEIYVKLKTTGALNLPAKIWDEDTYRLHKRKTLPGWGLLFGGLAALILYNLFVFVSLRETMYFYLACFLASSLLVTLHTEGFLEQFSQGNSILRWQELGAVFQCAALACAAAFTRVYLSTGFEYPVVDKFLLASLSMSLLLAICVSVGLIPLHFFFIGFFLCGVAFFVPSVVASLNVSDRATRYFLVGWSVFVLGYAIYQLGQFGLIPVNDVTVRLKEVALGVLGVTLSLGIASQIQKERFEKSKGLTQQQETMLELKYTEEQIQKKVLRDTLMEFPNLETLGVVAQNVIESVQETNESLTLVLVELHNLNQVEDKIGHAAKNELLTRATKRLSIVLRSIAGVVSLKEYKRQYVPMAVIDANRFAFLLRSMDDVAVNFAVDEVETSMQRPFFYQGVALQPGVSFGVARLSDSKQLFPSLFEHAIQSLRADTEKNLKKGYELESVDQYNPRNISLINELREAIQEDQITLYFQPIYDLRSNKVCGIEVLTRWEAELGEKINPNEIFYLAEVGGFVSEMTVKVIEKAICHYLIAIDPSQAPLKLSVNLSPKCLREDRFLEEVGVLLTKYQLPSKVLSFEIKEAAIIEDPSITREALNRIRSMGIGLTIDEFGAAYSNPSYMSSLPVTEVKLDQRIVARLDNKFHFDSVAGVITLCSEQDIKLVIHGVEDESTLSKLEQMGCTFAQGHYFAAPVKAMDFRLNRNPSRKSRYQRV